MKHLEALLSRLERVQTRGEDQWRASCPTSSHAHGDRSAGLHIKLAEDGRILICCMAGCPAADVVGAVGLRLSDLFPPRDNYRPIRQRARWNPYDIVRDLAFEALVVSIAAEHMAQGIELSAEDRQRLIVASDRTFRAAHTLGGAV